MDFVNFGTFETRSPLLTSDYLVGYKTTGPTEIKTQVKDILDLINDSDSQTLTFNEGNKNLSISSGNTVSLSSLSDTAFVQTNFFPLTGGIISGATRINNNLTVIGNLTATGTTTFTNTVFSTTSSLSVVHIGAGPAIWVGNNGTGDIASFYDIDQNIEILHVGGNNGTFPNVGVKTSVPNKTLTVAGEISATQDITNTGKIFTTGGNSDQWNAARTVTTAYQTASSSFATNTTLNSVSGLLTPLTLTNTLTGQLITNVQVFTSSDTWNKPAGAKSIHVAIIGGGGGGGSGRFDSSSTSRGGGSGGGGGSYSQLVLNADAVSSPVTVTVGAGGSGGAARSTVNDGLPGSPGGTSKFGIYGQSTGGAGGAGGTNATLVTRTAAGIGMHNGGDGGVGQVGTSAANRPGGNAVAAGGGGGGGGCSAANANSQGGDGGISFIMELAVAAGGITNGGIGGAGNSAGANQPTPGTGGGGGGGANIATGGTGGNGGNYGGGGGGGAGSNGTNSGTGGNGANGIVVVTTYF